jgi:hypothetical protein
MVHSSKIVHVLFLAAAVLCGCSQSDDTALENGSGNEAGENANVVFKLQSNTSSVTRSVEDSYTHVQGTADEYKVNVARVYLFDNKTKLFARTFQLKSFQRVGTDADGNVIYETERVLVPQGTYDVFVTANTNRVIQKTTEAEFLADIDSISYTQALIEDVSGGIIMANRATDNEATVIAERSDKQDNIINIKLERVVARLDIAKSAESFQLTDNNGQLYATVTLDGFYIVNVPKYFYTYRHTAVLTSLEAPEWRLPTNFGNVSDIDGYVIDPYFFKKTIDATNFRNADSYYERYLANVTNPQSVQWTAFNAVQTGQAPNYKTFYSLENCMLAPAQKNGYSTGVIFRSKMEPYAVYRLNGGSLEVINDKNQYPELLYYYNYKFYNSAEALAKAIGTDPSSTNLEQYQVRKFEKTDNGYRCYYNYWIRHLDNYKPTEMGVMEFGIVRNNLYRMLVTNVSDLGHGGTVPLVVVPDTPDEGETYLKVVLNVKPWIVRDQTNIVL